MCPRWTNRAICDVSLDTLLLRQGIKPRGIHNAGNNARYTVKALLAMCALEGPTGPLVM